MFSFSVLAVIFLAGSFDQLSRFIGRTCVVFSFCVNCLILSRFLWKFSGWEFYKTHFFQWISIPWFYYQFSLVTSCFCSYFVNLMKSIWRFSDGSSSFKQTAHSLLFAFCCDIPGESFDWSVVTSKKLELLWLQCDFTQTVFGNNNFLEPIFSNRKLVQSLRASFSFRFEVLVQSSLYFSKLKCKFLNRSLTWRIIKIS